MPPLMRTSKESPRGDVCAAQTHGVISTAETISTAAKARNLHRLIILFVLPFRGRLLDCTTPTDNLQSTPDRRSLLGLTTTRHVTHYYMVLGERLKGQMQFLVGTIALVGRPPCKRLSPNAYLRTSSELARECWPWQM